MVDIKAAFPGSNRHAVFLLNKPIEVVAFSLGATGLKAVTLLVRLGVHVSDYASPGIFFRFQIADFDSCFAFFSLCHFVFPDYLAFGLLV
jgi:hypothetical protein